VARLAAPRGSRRRPQDSDHVGLAGERDLRETELSHLTGYEGSRPVRIGNGAAEQYQADVVGEVMLALAALRDAGVKETTYSWGLQKNLLRYCEANLDRKDHGIWEMRGDPHFFTHGRAMIWAAFNEGIRAVDVYGLAGPVENWRALRERLRAEIDEHGFATRLNTFTQTYDNTEVDASLLQLPHTGFVAYNDPRMLGTVARIEQELQGESGLVHRYRTAARLDGLTGEEYPFLLREPADQAVAEVVGTGRLSACRAALKARSTPLVTLCVPSSAAVAADSCCGARRFRRGGGPSIGAG
jgi:GH15 family glucan-1,4-alpha-glucosidase